ncbi:MAG: hypothetical protein CL879_11225 [Dehalococcoidia bacterium]|nr:hypothetical protein [Dehalococcoidia bacterium]
MIVVSRLFGIFKGMRSDDDCDEVRGMSSDYIDGAATVSRHILKCGHCASFINTLQVTVGILRSPLKENSTPDFKQRIREQLNRERGN